MGGVFLILIGMFMLGVIKPRVLLKDQRFNIKKFKTRWIKINSLLTGFTFGFAWSPCIGPVLVVILFWSSQAETALKGTLLLLVYGLGIGLPFILVGLLFEKVQPYLVKTSKLSKWINYIAAIFVIVSGVLLIFDKLGYISIWFTNIVGLHVLSI